ncbi:MAG: tyrosine-type recombinase/integrase, partial [Hyphomicrobiales bacterium]|nr:tyrosine-type recombinase/integrase [Hyphomicrobiales bacterium]
YGSPEFFAEYQVAVAAITTAQPKGNVRAGTLEWLIRRYRESSAWEALAPATRDQRENIFRHVERQAGDISFKAITRAKIVEGREKRKATPNQANNFIKSMRGLFKWAADMEHVVVDPTRDVKLLTVKTDGFHVWTDDEVLRFEARWPIGTRERLAFDLLLYTGLRRGDAVRLGRQHVKDGVFRIKTEKNGVIVEAPILEPLRRSIDAAPTGDLAFIVGERGKPMTKESFGNWFRETCQAAGAPGSAHGLRKAGATRAAENGATTTELKAMFGWSDDNMPALYTKTADRARSAASSMSKIERKPKT